MPQDLEPEEVVADASEIAGASVPEPDGPVAAAGAGGPRPGPLHRRQRQQRPRPGPCQVGQGSPGRSGGASGGHRGPDQPPTWMIRSASGGSPSSSLSSPSSSPGPSCWAATVSWAAETTSQRVARAEPGRQPGSIRQPRRIGECGPDGSCDDRTHGHQPPLSRPRPPRRRQRPSPRHQPPLSRRRHRLPSRPRPRRRLRPLPRARRRPGRRPAQPASPRHGRAVTSDGRPGRGAGSVSPSRGHGWSASSWPREASGMAPCWRRWGSCHARRSCLPDSSIAPTTTGRMSIGRGQTISQPYMVARMTESLALTEAWPWSP